MALGKGLESLIPQKQNNSFKADQKKSVQKPGIPLGRSPLSNSNQTPKKELKEDSTTQDKRENIFYIEVDRIKPNPHQPRGDFNEAGLRDLADSIKTHGILQPLVVAKHEIEKEYGRGMEYHIIAGERRWRAAKLAGFSQVPVIIRQVEEQNKLELALVENLQRTDLNSIEEARAYQKLANDFSLTQEQIARRVAKSREVVANKIRLLGLPYQVQQMVMTGNISESHAKVLLSLSNPEKQTYLAKEGSQKNLSVRALEEIVKEETQPGKKRFFRRPLDPELAEYTRNIQETLGAPVSISGSKEKGRLAISFYSPEELERIIKKLTE